MPPKNRQPRANVTLTQIAEACGVATSTVSRALSNPNRVSAATYNLVAQKAKELGYRSALLSPAYASSVRGGVALVVPNLTNPFVMDLVRGSQAQAQAAGYRYLLAVSGESAQVERDWLTELATAVEGVILSSPRSPDAVLSSISKDVPTIVLHREVPWLSGLVIDTPSAVARAFEYLVSLGHRYIAYARGPEDSWTDRQRFRALEEVAKKTSANLVPLGSFYPSFAAGAAAADAVLQTRSTAAIFFNDVLALGALDRFRHRGVDVPGDISVVGCDDIFGASFSNPPLTTITSDGERVGRLATELLLGEIQSRESTHQSLRLSAHLTIRSSTGPVPAQRSITAERGVAGELTR